MSQFEKCKACRRKFNDGYCLYCFHHYRLKEMNERDMVELRDFFCEDKYPNIYGAEIENVN